MTPGSRTAPDWHDASAVPVLAPKGRLRVAINFGNPVLAQRHPDTGEPAGVTADLTRDLAAHLGLEIDFLPFDSAGTVAQIAQDDVWDVAFLAIDPQRAQTIAYTRPYVLIEGTYLVPEASPLKSQADVDQPGVTVAVGEGAAYDLYLSRTLRHAEIVRYATSDEAIERFLQDGLSTAAGVRQPLERHARLHEGFRVLAGRFTDIRQAVGCPKGRPEAAKLLDGYVAHAIASGLVADGLRRSGQHDATVAPLTENPA